MPLTILFHGTGDTQYQDDRAYLAANKLEPIVEGAHTLSFFADCIAVQAEQIVEPLFSQMAPTKQDPYLLHISNERVIIQGADDTGTEVHNLIVSGLMAALNGIMRGERKINFFGFSRGSVEAIHMTHELQRIKDYVTHPGNDLSPTALYAFICDHCYNPGKMSKWRTNRIKDLYKEALNAALQNPELLQSLINGLRSPELKLNGKLLDPVPGLCEGSAWFYLPWTNLAHHTMIASMVNELDIAYMDSEFSVGFRAVWVEATPGSETQITRYPLPGSHSTANGNPVNHHPDVALAVSPRFPFEKMRGVQKVFFYKLLQFASRHHIVLKAPEEMAERYLSPVFQHFIEHRDDIAAQNEFLRTQYREIADNIAAYRETRKTCYIPDNLLGFGGIEHTDHERKLMTQSGERSMATCFSFDFKSAKSYVNFESFSLDFMTLLFPELSTPPSGSPHRPLSYSGIGPIVLGKYASSSQEMDCALLNTKIKALLAACQSHQFDTALNKILLQDGLDRDGILDQLADLVPAKLANSFYNSNLTQADRENIQEAITAILHFELPPLGAEEDTETHQNLFRKKQAYIEKFQKNMHREMIEQTHLSLANLLDATEQFQRGASNPIWDAEHADQAQPFDAIEYLVEAEKTHQAMITLQDKLSFSNVYLLPSDRDRLQYKIDESVAQFPAICERVLHKHAVDVAQAPILEFTVMLPLKERLAHEQEMRAELNRRTQRIATLDREKTTATQQLGHTQRTVEKLRVEKAALTEQIHQHEATNLATQAAIRTVTDRLLNIQNTLFSHQKNGHYSGFTFMLQGSLSIILGAIIVAIATHFLLLGTAGLIVPTMSLGLGTGMTFFGISALRTGAHRQREEQLNATFFPENR